MKEKRAITVLVLLLVVLIFRLGMTKMNQPKQEQTTKENMDVIRVMSKMENDMAKDKSVQEFAESNAMLPLDVEFMLMKEDAVPVSENSAMDADNNSGQSNNRVGVDTNEKLPEYSNLYPDLYVEKIHPECSEECQKIAYLTFDDGPSENTLKILEILKEKQAVATFFVLGSTMTPEGEQALKQMTDMGCKIGIHTYSHQKNVIYNSVQGFLDDFYKCYKQVYEITGEKPNIFRFPWGSYNKYSKPIKKNLVAEMDRRGFTYFDWNVSAEDSVGKPSEYSIMKNIMKDVTKYDQPVILMHDACINKLTVRMLPQVIDKLKELGYSFDTLDHRKPCQFGW